MEEIGVSVLCITYNQEKYIRQCLEGFVMQKTNFPFEVIINDDASTDKTPEIIKEYANKYPNIIKPIYQKENQYSKGVSILIECCFPKAKGKYLAFCEGDDFWTDENKLQLQYDAMEKNPDCHLCIHKVQSINENGECLNRTYPDFNLQEKIINTEEFFRIIFIKYQFHTSSYFLIKEDYKKYINDFTEIRQMYRKYRVGDEAMLMYFGQLNNTYYINKIMSKYRCFALNSWNINDKRHTRDFKFKRYVDYMQITQKFDEYTSYKYHSLCILRTLRFSIGMAKNTPNKKDLLFKNRKEFFGRFNLFQKSVLLIYILFPNLATQLRKIYKIFKY